MIIRMLIQMSGSRYDDRMWPPPFINFEVPDEEGRGLIASGVALEVEMPKEEKPAPPAPPADLPAAVFEPLPSSSNTPAPAAVSPEPPRATDSKQDWVEYAVSQGAVRAEVENQTKAQLQSVYGGRL